VGSAIPYPVHFFAKEELFKIPVLGWYIRRVNAFPVNRGQGDIGAVKTAQRVLEAGEGLVLFPEGTSSGGETILPFKSSLLAPAARQTHSLTAGLLQYELRDGDVSEEVCYWKDMTLVPHLVNLCSKRTIQASVYFNRVREGSADRKQLARQLHAEVLRMKHAFESRENHRQLRHGYEEMIKCGG